MRKNARLGKILIGILSTVLATSIFANTTEYKSRKYIDLTPINANYNITSEDVTVCSGRANLAEAVAYRKHFFPLYIQIRGVNALIYKQFKANMPLSEISQIHNIILRAYEMPVMMQPKAYGDQIFENCMFTARILKK